MPRPTSDVELELLSAAFNVASREWSDATTATHRSTGRDRRAPRSWYGRFVGDARAMSSPAFATPIVERSIGKDNAAHDGRVRRRHGGTEMNRSAKGTFEIAGWDE